MKTPRIRPDYSDLPKGWIEFIRRCKDAGLYSRDEEVRLWRAACEERTPARDRLIFDLTNYGHMTVDQLAALRSTAPGAA